MKIAVLHVIKDLTNKIECEKVRLIRLKTLVKNCTAELDGMPHAHNGQSRVEQLAAAIVDCENKLNELRAIRINCRIELSLWIDTHIKDNAQGSVLFYRYGLCKSFKVIGKELGYSESTVFRLHRLGLNALQIRQSLSEIWEFDKALGQTA